MLIDLHSERHLPMYAGLRVAARRPDKTVHPRWFRDTSSASPPHPQRNAACDAYLAIR